jgi:hypothetical protein
LGDTSCPAFTFFSPQTKIPKIGVIGGYFNGLSASNQCSDPGVVPFSNL